MVFNVKDNNKNKNNNNDNNPRHPRAQQHTHTHTSTQDLCIARWFEPLNTQKHKPILGALVVLNLFREMQLMQDTSGAMSTVMR